MGRNLFKICVKFCERIKSIPYIMYVYSVNTYLIFYYYCDDIDDDMMNIMLCIAYYVYHTLHIFYGGQLMY